MKKSIRPWWSSLSNRALTMLGAFVLLAGIWSMPSCSDGDGNDSTAQDAGGSDSASSEVNGSPDTTASACLSSSEASSPSVSGRIYNDQDNSDESRYSQSFDSATDQGIGGVEVHLLGTSPLISGETCSDGSFAIGPLDDGVYLLEVGLEDGQSVTSKNRPARLPEAIREGAVTIVTFGDSIPVVGDSPFYPARLAEILAPLATIENINVAVGGTTSENWLPGTNLYENTLVPEIADADVIMISLGGNDVLYYANDAMSNIATVPAALEGLGEFLLEVMDNVMTTVDAIREINPNVDIVYGLYPNYAETDLWYSFLGGATVAISEKMVEGIEMVRATLDSTEDIVLIDLYGAWPGEVLNDYLYDQLHFNDAGQRAYAEEVFQALGGVRIGSDALGTEISMGCYNPDAGE